MKNNYEEDLIIDPEQLDVEWMNQPRLYMMYAARLADVDSDKARAKEKLDVIKAEVDAEIRAEAKADGVVVDKTYLNIFLSII